MNRVVEIWVWIYSNYMDIFYIYGLPPINQMVTQGQNEVISCHDTQTKVNLVIISLETRNTEHGYTSATTDFYLYVIPIKN